MSADAEARWLLELLDRHAALPPGAPERELLADAVVWLYGLDRDWLAAVAS